MTLLEWLGAIITLLGVWLTARKQIAGWIAGIAGAIIYTYICFQVKLYAESFLQLLYAGMGIFGYITWKSMANKDFEVRKISVIHFGLSLLAWFVLMIFFGTLLERYADSDLPFTDAGLTAAGLVLTWQMARRYLECWAGWIIADVLSSIVFVYKNLYPTAVLYSLLAVLAWYGHQSWKNKSASQ